MTRMEALTTTKDSLLVKRHLHAFHQQKAVNLGPTDCIGTYFVFGSSQNFLILQHRLMHFVWDIDSSARFFLLKARSKVRSDPNRLSAVCKSVWMAWKVIHCRLGIDRLQDWVWALIWKEKLNIKKTCLQLALLTR